MFYYVCYNVITRKITGMPSRSYDTLPIISSEEAIISVPEYSYKIEDIYITVDNEVKIKPGSPNESSLFNTLTEQWEYSPELHAQYIERCTSNNQDIRSQLLGASDWTDTVSAQTRLGDLLCQAWQDYRQALRDITLQPTYPLDVIWPIAP
jgi:hypothetical protein